MQKPKACLVVISNYEIMGRTSRKKIAILEEGVVLVSDVDQLDFVGAGVSGAITGSNPVTVQETIPGGGASTTPVIGEPVSFSGTAGTLAHTPAAGTLRLY